MDVAPRQPGLELILNTTPIQMLVLEKQKLKPSVYIRDVCG
jgi:hypothetical protein